LAIVEIEKECFDKIWYVRKLILQEKIESGEDESPGAAMEERINDAMRDRRAVRVDHVGPWDDWGGDSFTETLCLELGARE
jgi:hypothetical protein